MLSILTIKMTQTVGRVNIRRNHVFLDLKKALVLKCEMYMDRKHKKNREDQSTLSYIIFTCKKYLCSLTANKNCL